MSQGDNTLQELTAAWTPASGNCSTAPSASSLGGPAPYLDEYSYNLQTGNRTGATVVNGTVSTQQVYAYPAAQAARPHAVSTVTATGSTNGTNTYGYDTAGDTTSRPGQTLTYNPAGQLATVTMGSATLQDVYGASGALLLQSGSSGSTLYLGDTELHQASGSSQVSAVRTYSLAGMVFAERTTTAGATGDGTLDWVGTDVDGTADLEVNSSTGVVTRRFVDPFGNTRGTPVVWSSDHGYLNKPDNAQTGLAQLGAREYDPSLGRFLTVDSVLAPDNPQQNNGYAYSGNDPVTNADPSGNCYEAASDSFNLNTNCVGGHGITKAGATPTPGSFTPHAAGNTSNRGGSSHALAHSATGATIVASPLIRLIFPTIDWGALFGGLRSAVGGLASGAGVVGMSFIGDVALVLSMSGDTEDAGQDQATAASSQAASSAPDPGGDCNVPILCKSSRDSAAGELQQTAHGAARAADSSRLDPAAQADVVANPTRTYTQMTGRGRAQVFVQDVGGRYNVVVQGQNGVITNLKTISETSLNKLASRYGWMAN